MEYQGDYAEDATVYIMFNTFTSNDPSASSTITDFINTDVHIHKDNGLTQRNNAAGITVSVDFDGITGSHMIVIDTSDDTVGGFWVTGSDYFVRIEGTTVDGATINAVVGHFSIENRFNQTVVPDAAGVAATPAEVATALGTYDGPTKAEMDTAHALLATPAQVATELGTYDGPTKAEMDTGHGLLATPAQVATELGTYDGPTKAEMDTAHALLATVAKQDVIDGIVDAILVDTAVIGALGAGLSGIPWNAAWDAEVQSEVADGLAAYDPPTKTEMDTAHALLATVAKQDVIDGIVDAILLDTGTDGVILKAAGLNADAVDEIYDEVIEGTLTFRQAMRVVVALLTGISTGGGTVTPTFRDIADSKARVTFTADADGNRTASTIDGT